MFYRTMFYCCSNFELLKNLLCSKNIVNFSIIQNCFQISIPLLNVLSLFIQLTEQLNWCISKYLYINNHLNNKII